MTSSHIWSDCPWLPVAYLTVPTLLLTAVTIGCGFKTRETKHESDKLLVGIGTDDQPAIVDGGDEHVRGDHIRFTAGPDGALQFFDGGHFFGGIKDFYNRSRHRVGGEAGSLSG